MGILGKNMRWGICQLDTEEVGNILLRRDNKPSDKMLRTSLSKGKAFIINSKSSCFYLGKNWFCNSSKWRIYTSKKEQELARIDQHTQCRLLEIRILCYSIGGMRDRVLGFRNTSSKKENNRLVFSYCGFQKPGEMKLTTLTKIKIPELQ